MLAVVLTLVFLLLLSVAIIAAVAVPRLREEGTQLLTPRGEQVLREAKARLTRTSAGG